MPDTQSIQEAREDARPSSEIAPSFEDGLGVAHHYAEPIRNAEEARRRVAAIFGLGEDDPHLPFVELPTLEACGAEDNLSVFRRASTEVQRAFDYTKNRVCYVYALEAPIRCLKESEAKANHAKKIYKQGIVCYLYKNGCKVTDFDDIGIDSFTSDKFDPTIIEKYRKSKDMRNFFRTALLDVLNKPELAGASKEIKNSVFFEIMNGRPSYSDWTDTDDFKSVKVTRGKNKSIHHVPVTKYFEIHWLDFRGGIDDLKYDPSLYNTVRMLIKRRFPNFMSDLRSHLEHLSVNEADAA